VKIKPIVGSPFFGVFPSDRIPKATKDVNVVSFTHVVISCKLCQLIPVNCTSEFWEHSEASTHVAANNIKHT